MSVDLSTVTDKGRVGPAFTYDNCQVFLLVGFKVLNVRCTRHPFKYLLARCILIALVKEVAEVHQSFAMARRLADSTEERLRVPSISCQLSIRDRAERVDVLPTCKLVAAKHLLLGLLHNRVT